MHATVQLRSSLELLKGMIALMRPRQWVKNAFVLGPLLFAGEFLNPQAIEKVLLATVLFCLGSAAVYIVNDLHDIEQYRRNSKKSHTRP